MPWQWCLLVGDVGCYLLKGLLGDDQERSLFRFFYAVEAVIRNRRIDVERVEDLRQELLQAMAEVEEFWPKLVATRVFHSFSHAVDSLTLLGPFYAWAMWYFENDFGHTIRKLRGKRHITRELEHNAKGKILAAANHARSFGLSEIPPPKHNAEVKACHTSHITCH